MGTRSVNILINVRGSYICVDPMRTSPFFFTENMFSDLGLYHDMDTVDKLNFYTENKEWKVMKKKHAFEKKQTEG